MKFRKKTLLKVWTVVLGVSLVLINCRVMSFVPGGYIASTKSNPQNGTTQDQTIPGEQVKTPSPSSSPLEADSLQPSHTHTIEQATPTVTFFLPPTETVQPSATRSTITRFAVIGDYGLAGKPESDVAALIKGWDPDFIITTGDNNYPDGMPETIDENIGQYFHNYIYPYTGDYGEGSDINRFFPSMGNHDWSITRGKTYLDYFTLPGNERYYDFVWGNVHLFAIDTDGREPDGVGRSSVQGQWLKKELAASTSVWKIVYMHLSPYASSGEGSIDWTQWPYREWGATAVLSGHSHVYERIIVDGFPYFVNGLGGGPRYDFDEHVPGSQVRFRDDYGAMLIEASTDQITFQFVTRENLVIDTYVIQKKD